MVIANQLASSPSGSASRGSTTTFCGDPLHRSPREISPSPRRCRDSHALRPNSSSRVLSGCSSKPSLASPGPRAALIGRASALRIRTFRCFNAILFVAEHGCKWRGLPARSGNWHTIYLRMNRCRRTGCSTGYSSICGENRSCASSSRRCRRTAPLSRSIRTGRGHEKQHYPVVEEPTGALLGTTWSDDATSAAREILAGRTPHEVVLLLPEQAPDARQLRIHRLPPTDGEQATADAFAAGDPELRLAWRPATDRVCTARVASHAREAGPPAAALPARTERSFAGEPAQVCEDCAEWLDSGGAPSTAIGSTALAP